MRVKHWKDRTGKRFGRLIAVIELAPRIGKNGRKFHYWGCVCDCGNFCKVANVAMATGFKQSCGCLRREAARENIKKTLIGKHLEAALNTDLYKRYHGILNRLNSNCKRQRPYYKDRGIKMCDEWKNDYLSFKKWALENGFKKELTIDRIDNDKGYSPENCRWATRKEQAQNRAPLGTYVRDRFKEKDAVI